MRTHRLTALGFAAFSVVAVPDGVSAQEVRWTSQFGTSGFDAIYAVDDVDGDVYGVGEAEGALPGQTWAGSCDVIVRKYRGNGSVKWTQQFGTSGCDFGEAVAASVDGLYVGGSVEGALPEQVPTGDFDAFVRKYGGDGNELWTRQFGTGDFDKVAGAAADRHNVYVAGQVCGALPDQQASGPCDAFVRKYDGDGNELWTRQFGATGFAAANDIDVGPAGVVVVGRVVGALPGQQAVGARDVFVRLYDARGNERWTRQFGTTGNDIAWGVDVEGLTIYVAGDASGALPGQGYGGGPIDAFVRTYDARGTERWTRQFGTGGFDRAIRVAADGAHVAVVGRVGGALPGQAFSGGATDPFARLYDVDGHEKWTIQFGGELEPEAATGVTLDDEDIFISGGISAALIGQTHVGYIDAFVMKVPA